MPTLLAMDVGTTNWKAAVFDGDGLIGTADMPALTRTDAHGQFYDGQEMWAGLAGLTRRLLDEFSIATVDAVCITSMAETGVPIGTDGTPVYPAITWFDPRSGPQAAEMDRRIGAARLYELTGLDPNPVFSVPKIAWIRDNEPSLFAKIDRWLSVADYITFRLTGEMATDYSLASRTLAFDLDTATWSTEILGAMGLSAGLFPPVVAAGTLIGTVTPQASRATGLRQGTPVVVGGHDHHCAFLSAGALMNDVVLDSSGTVESIMTLLPADRPRPRKPNGMRVGFFIDPARYATMGGILASGASVEWAIRNIWDNEDGENSPLSRYEQVIAAAGLVRPGCEGLCFLPHLLGAGAPVWEPRSRGAFVGLRTEHSRAHLMRAVIEGLCLELRGLLSSVEEGFGLHLTALNTVGGGARNHLWQQIKADVTGLSVTIPDVSEATAQGAALLAGLGIGVYPSLVEASHSTFKVLRRFDPDPSNRETYARLLDVHRRIYGQLREINLALASLDQHRASSRGGTGSQ